MRRAFVVLLCTIAMPLIMLGQQQYTITDLGDLSDGSAINASGQIAGYSGNFPGVPNFDAAVWSNGNWHDLGSTFSFGSNAWSINNSGQVAGEAYTAYNSGREAILWDSNGSPQILGSLPGGGESVAWGINDSGQTVGYIVVNGPPNSRAVLWNNGTAQDLGSGGAWGINNAGQVSGFSGNAAVIWNNGSVQTLDMLPGGNFAYGVKINSSRQIAGYGYTSSYALHAILWTNGSAQDLGTLVPGLWSVGWGINDAGEVVGWSEGADGNSHASLFVGGQVKDLNSLIPANSNWLLNTARDINSAGQITGYGIRTNVSLSKHAFLLTPITPYKALVQPPINADGSSIFKANRGVIPLRFSLTENDISTCALPSATISVTRTAGGVIGSVDEGTYSMAADDGSNFRIDRTACQYIYNLAANALGVGVYRVDININGSVVGSAAFALK